MVSYLRNESGAHLLLSHFPFPGSAASVLVTNLVTQMFNSEMAS